MHPIYYNYIKQLQGKSINSPLCADILTYSSKYLLDPTEKKMKSEIFEYHSCLDICRT